MKRGLWWVTLLALWATPVSAQWAVADSDSLYSAGSASTIQLTMTVGADDFIYVCAASGSESTAISSIDLNTNAETLELVGPFSDAAEAHWVAWSLASSQSGSVTIDVTYASAVTDRVVAAFVMTHTAGTVALAAGGSAAGGIGTEMNSGAWTAVGSDLAAFACGYTSPVIGTQLIQGATRTDALEPIGNFNLWWGPIVAGSASGSATLSSGSVWVASAIDFNVTATGGSSGPPFGTLNSLGIGR